jgi:glycosyltransferase involved in cell wall biosynthesis
MRVSGEQLTAVIPVYNEQQLLAQYVPDSIKKLQQAYTGIKILIIENGSTDSSQEMATKIAAELDIDFEHLDVASYGNAFREGLSLVKTAYSIWFNADWIDIDFVEDALLKLEAEQKVDIVIGCKSHRESSDKRPFYRKILSIILTKLMNRSMGYSGGDTHGIKMFRMSDTLLNLIKSTTQNELVESELLIQAQKAKLVLSEIPIKLEEIRSPRVNIVKRAKEDLKEIKSIKWKQYQNKK